MKYLFYFLLTLVTEYVCLQAILGWRAHRLRVALSTLTANLVTHPLAYGFMSYVVASSRENWLQGFLITETVVPIIESGIAVALLRKYGFSSRRLILGTFAANILTASLSFVIPPAERALIALFS